MLLGAQNGTAHLDGENGRHLHEAGRFWLAKAGPKFRDDAIAKQQRGVRVNILLVNLFSLLQFVL